MSRGLALSGKPSQAQSREVQRSASDVPHAATRQSHHELWVSDISSRAAR